MFSHTCSRCGKKWDLPIQLDASRPMYCPECMPIVREERKQSSTDIKKVMRTPPPPELSGGTDAPSRHPRIAPVQPEERGTVKIVHEPVGGASSDELSLAALLRPTAPTSSVTQSAPSSPSLEDSAAGADEKKRRRRKRGGKKIREAQAAQAAGYTPSQTKAESDAPAPRPSVAPPLRPLASTPEIVAFPDVQFDRAPDAASPAAQPVPPGQRIRFE